MSGLWARLFGAVPRVRGRPTSANRASSFHLWWELPAAGPFAQVSAVLEVVQPPTVDRLYFWALQVDFTEGVTSHGGAHLGLQWNRRHPGMGAANWGGYDHRGSILSGSPSPLASTPNDLNTRDFAWQPNRPYRLTVRAAPSPPGAWRGEIADVTTGEVTVVRDLYGGGSGLVRPVVWSEVFADCDHPPVKVRWSHLTAATLTGDEVTPAGVRVNYQSRRDGGCDNTTVAIDGSGVLQITNQPRAVPQGRLLPLP